MQKLKLDVDGLRVESFEAIRAESGIGTVRAHGAAEQRNPGEAAAEFGTYYVNCFYTQQASCTC